MRNVIKLREILEANRNLYGPRRGLTVTCEAISTHLAEHRKKVAEGKSQREDYTLYGFQLRELAEAICGPEWVASLQPGRMREGLLEQPIETMESGAGVTVSAFANITNQLISSKIHEGYTNPQFVAASLVQVVPTRLSGERMATAGSIPDNAQTVNETMPYPTVGFTEHFVDTPATIKRGLICAVSREAIFFDQTGQVARRAFSVGEIVGRSREERIIDVVIGVTNPYSEKGTAQNTYQDGTPSFDNHAATNTLIDWTDIETAQLLLDAMADPANTSQPIASVPDTIIVHTAKAWTARRIVSAVETRTSDKNIAANTQEFTAGNPVPALRVVSSPYINFRYSAGSIANTTWFYGRPTSAFLYMENWPLTITQAPPNDPASFEQDIVLRVRASERGAAAVMEPRHMVRSVA